MVICSLAAPDPPSDTDSLMWIFGHVHMGMNQSWRNEEKFSCAYRHCVTVKPGSHLSRQDVVELEPGVGMGRAASCVSNLFENDIDPIDDGITDANLVANSAKDRR